MSRRAECHVEIAGARVRGYADPVLEQPELGDGITSNLGVRRVECGGHARVLIGHWVGRRCGVLCVEGAEGSRGARNVRVALFGDGYVVALGEVEDGHESEVDDVLRSYPGHDGRDGRGDYCGEPTTKRRVYYTSPVSTAAGPSGALRPGRQSMWIMLWVSLDAGPAVH
jgi:hypothetical protein